VNPIFKLAIRDLTRRKGRTAATICGAALAVFLFASIESLASGLAATLRSDSASESLVVYRKSRYCPQTSRLPEAFAATIAAAPGVRSVSPKRVFMNNCRANLDLVLFIGVDDEVFLEAGTLRFLEGDETSFRDDAASALVGVGFAKRRGVAAGQSFRFGEIDVKVAGIVESKDPVENDAIFTHLAYLQRAVDDGTTGIVTQFDVRVAQGADADTVARAIDERLATSDAPTKTFSRSEFLARATGELAALVGFARWFGVACVLVLCVLLANTSLLSIAERSREHAVLLAIGYRAGHVATIVLLEAACLAFLGAALGALAAFALARLYRVTIGIEGIPIALDSSLAVYLKAGGLSLLSCSLAALLPATLASRISVAYALRGA